MVYLTEKSFLNKKAELDYLTKVRRPRLARLLLSLPLIEESARRQIEGQRVLVEDEIAKLIAVIRRARVIRGVDIERASIGGKSKIKWLADD